MLDEELVALRGWLEQIKDYATLPECANALKIRDLLVKIYKLTDRENGLSRLELAIPVLKSKKLLPDDKKIVETVAALFLAEQGGHLKPPPSLSKLYLEIIATAKR